MSNEQIEQIIREYINKTQHMSLATVSDDKPWVCEVHFVYDQNLNVYFRSQPHRRHSQEIAINPNVAGNIVRQHAEGEYPHAIYFEGTAEQVADQKQFAEIAKLFTSSFAYLGEAQAVIDDAQAPEGHKFYKITVDNWYAFGKFGGDKGQKYQLSWNGGDK